MGKGLRKSHIMVPGFIAKWIYPSISICPFRSSVPAFNFIKQRKDQNLDPVLGGARFLRSNQLSQLRFARNYFVCVLIGF